MTTPKADQAVTLASRTSVKIKDQWVEVEPKLLFQRLVTAGECDDEFPYLFKFELCSYPPALLESSHLHFQANKFVLADALLKVISNQFTKPTETVQFVLDGGALLDHIPWPHGITYDRICQLDTDYVAKKYGKPTVSFDGYDDGPSTKDATRLRCSWTHIAVTVHVTEDMVLKSNKHQFLANKTNKQLFINLLSESLAQAASVISHAQQDADLLIVKTTVQSAEVNYTILVRDDTNLLILLIYHANLQAKQIFSAPEIKPNSKTNRVWNIKQLQHDLGEYVCDHILFIHAILGCDTVSQVHGLGKGVALKKNEKCYISPACTSIQYFKTQQ